MVEVEWHPPKLAGEVGDVAHPLVDPGTHRREGVTPGDRGRVDDDDPADVHELGGSLQVEEARVEAGKPVHLVSSGR